MEAFEQSLGTLERELQLVSDTFAGLTEDEWRVVTLLEPPDAGRPHWTVFELAGHFDISIGLTRMLVADQQDGQPGRDRVSFFIFPRSEVAPTVSAGLPFFAMRMTSATDAPNARIDTHCANVRPK